jgi:hypothetical protein
MYSVQISTSNDESISITEGDAKANNISIINSKLCQQKLKSDHNLTDDMDLIIAKIDMYFDLVFEDADIGLLSDLTTMYIFDPKTKEEYDMSQCNGVPIEIKLPIKYEDQLNLPMYHDLMNQSNIDVFDPNSTAFQSRCFSMVDNNTQYDTTLNYRRENYFQNKTVNCYGGNCTYQGIDDNNYVKCNCTQIDTEIQNEFVEYLMEAVSTWNFDVVQCYELIFNVSRFITP